jgi:aryl-alcohol dehydrogenase-like predicted oxidoreductase
MEANVAELHELSRIGFGCYRISRLSKEHYDALQYALSVGCNLIDTAATYTNGESELLVGEMLANHSNRNPFVVTKAGYVNNESLKWIEDRYCASSIRDEVIETSGGSFHCIHPDFLDGQLHLSCRRLKRAYVDGFLLHNPEYYFDQVDRPISTEQYYARIKNAFTFLEEQVERERVHYYGVSSNTLPFSTAQPRTTSLPRLLRLAEAVSANHHFKLIQFPLNFIENDALLDHHDGQSLIATARTNNIVTLSNRPLNANCNGTPLRFATYTVEVSELQEERDREILENCIQLIRRRLDEVGIDDDVMAFVPLQVVSCSWTSFSHPDVVAEVFEQRVVPFLLKLFNGEIDDEVSNAFAKLRHMAVLYARRNLTQKALTFRQGMVKDGVIACDDPRSLPLIACQTYLDAGVDHVLVGMRSPAYVDSLRRLF